MGTPGVAEQLPGTQGSLGLNPIWGSEGDLTIHYCQSWPSVTKEKLTPCAVQLVLQMAGCSTFMPTAHPSHTGAGKVMEGVRELKGGRGL